MIFATGGSFQCHWFIYVKPKHKILLYFEDFEVEGKPNGEFISFLNIGAKTFGLNEFW